MCGIAGWIDRKLDLTTQRPVIEAMTQTLANRGPDASGLWLSPRAAIGHRRLIVIDSRGGGQPMVKHLGSRRYVLTYNGELYNAPELRRELEARGHRFFGYSDTEVVLTAFMEWGPECLARFNGMFAFGLWDEADETLYLARDPLGIKPLFWVETGDGLLFASEIKALLAHPALPAEVDAEGLAEIFGLGPARTPGHGVFRRVRELRPGQWLAYSPRGVSLHRYWSLESHPHGEDPEATAGRILELLRDAVTRQLVSDVPLGVLLSGGLDSTAVTALAAEALAREGRPTLTFSVDYRDNDRFFRASDFQPSSDAPWVEKASAYFGTRHRAVVLDTPSLVESLTVTLRARDLPGMADIDASLYLFCRQVKKEATVALVGEGADEVFGGYPWFRRPDALAADTFPWALSVSLRRAVLAPELDRKLQLEEYVAERYRQALAEVPRLPGEDPEAARRREIAYLSLTRFLPVLLERMDRMSMAVGLEIRVPYCDHRLVNYAWNLPWELKAFGGEMKGILRRALKGLLPPEILSRRKSPYPKTYDPQYFASVRAALLEALEDPASPLRPLLNLHTVRELGAEGDTPLPWFGQLMTAPQVLAYLWQVDRWLRDYRIRLRLE